MQGRGHCCKVFYFDETEQIDCNCEKKRISFWKSINFGRFDVVHTHGIRPNLYVRIHHRQKNTLFVSTMHSYMDEFEIGYGHILGRWIGRLFLFSVKKHDKLVALSRDMTAHYQQWIAEDKIEWAYNGIDFHEESIAPEPVSYELSAFFRKGDVRLICNSALVRLKGVDTAIRALVYLPAHYKLWVNGEGQEKRRLAGLARELGVQGRIHFAGQVSHPYSYFRQMDVFIQCSRSEGFCLSMAEAAVTGLKIVSSDIPGMREKYSDEEVVYYEIGENHEECSRHLATAVRRAMGQDGMGERARQKVMMTFSIDRMGESYEQIYSKYVAQR